MVTDTMTLPIIAGAAAAAALSGAAIILIFKTKNSKKPKHSIKSKSKTEESSRENEGAVLYLNPVSEGVQLCAPLGETVTVGRDKHSDIFVNDKLVSARQCVFTCEEGSVYIEDAGSTNGTILNGILLKSKTAVKDGDTILIGNTEYSILIL